MRGPQIPKVSTARPLRLFAASLALCALSAAACGGSAGETATTNTTAAPRPSLPAQTIDGKRLDLVDLVDEDTVLWFWAPW